MSELVSCGRHDHAPRTSDGPPTHRCWKPREPARRPILLCDATFARRKDPLTLTAEDIQGLSPEDLQQLFSSCRRSSRTPRTRNKLALAG